MPEHDLKCWPEFFEAVVSGKKTLELRRDDRGFKVGDTMLLREWIPETAMTDGCVTGRVTRVEITHIVRGGMFGLEAGHVALSIKRTGQEYL